MSKWTVVTEHPTATTVIRCPLPHDCVIMRGRSDKESGLTRSWKSAAVELLEVDGRGIMYEYYADRIEQKA